MKLSVGKVGNWNMRLAFDVALLLEGSGDIKDIQKDYDLDRKALEDITKDKVFSRHVSDYQDEIRSGGLSFKIKARVLSEELLNTSWLLIHDEATSPSVKADLIKGVVKWAGLAGDKKLDGVVGGSGAPSIVINMPQVISGSVSGRVIDGGT